MQSLFLFMFNIPTKNFFSLAFLITGKERKLVIAPRLYFRDSPCDEDW